MPRLTCPRCLRPANVCYCSKLERIASRTHVVILQHPRERRIPVSTARMAHLSLESSELHYGVCFEDDPRLLSLRSEPGTYVLFPGPGAVDPSALRSAPPRNLVVVDGTWPLAKKVLRLNPGLCALPRIGLSPRRPSNYRIRKEPAEHCVSTIEAVAEVLGALEGDHARFDRMLGAFELMVDRQLHFAKNRTGPLRYLVRRSPPKPRVPIEIREQFAQCVAVYAEANAHAKGSGFEGPGELIQLVAERSATGERFAAFIAPRRSLGSNVPLHLDVPAEKLVAGEPVGDVLERFRGFLRPQDVLCGWGRFTADLLSAEGVLVERQVDLKRVSAQVLHGSPGSMEEALSRLRATAPRPWAEGRAGRRIATLSGLLTRFYRGPALLQTG